MNLSVLKLWFSLAALIGVVFGVVYAFLGLGILPVAESVLVPWGNGVYALPL